MPASTVGKAGQGNAGSTVLKPCTLNQQFSVVYSNEKKSESIPKLS